MDFEIFFTGEADIVRCHNWNRSSHRQVHCLNDVLLITNSARPLQFQIKPVAEKLKVFVDQLLNLRCRTM